MSRATNIRETASVSVLLEAILPLLLFLAFRSISSPISKPEAQSAAFMAPTIACPGFVVFRRMIMVYNSTDLLRCRKELITH